MRKHPIWNWLVKLVAVLALTMWAFPAMGALGLAVGAVVSPDRRRGWMLAKLSLAAGFWCAWLSLIGLAFAPRLFYWGILPVIPGMVAALVAWLRAP